jgi:hypothetical protein
MFSHSQLLGIGQPPSPPPPPPPPPFPMIWPPYQPTVVIERDYSHQVASPCEWYEDLHAAGDTVYCRAPAVWLVIAAVGAGTLLVMLRRKG